MRMASIIINTVRDNAYAVKVKSVDVIDSQLPPSRRRELIDNIQSWSANNPKLAGFVFAQLVLSGIPILVFSLFTGIVFISSIATCLIIGLVIGLSFTAFCVGGALLVLLPTLFATSIAATILFAWGLFGYYITRRLNNGEMPVNSVQDAREKIRYATNESIAKLQNTYESNVKPMLPYQQQQTSTSQGSSRSTNTQQSASPPTTLSERPNGVPSKTFKDDKVERDRELAKDIEVLLKVEKDPSGTMSIAPIDT